MIFPEGTRSTDGALGTAEIGLGMIAHATHSPVVPIYMKGTHKAFSSMHPGFRLTATEIHYGKPLCFEEEYSRRGDRATLEAINARVMQEIAALRDKANAATT